VSEVPAYLEKVATIYDTFEGPHLKHLDAAVSASQVLGKLFELTMDVLAAAKAGHPRT
jgi:hypothetical protein